MNLQNLEGLMDAYAIPVAKILANGATPHFDYLKAANIGDVIIGNCIAHLKYCCTN